MTYFTLKKLDNPQKVDVSGNISEHLVVTNFYEYCTQSDITAPSKVKKSERDLIEKIINLQIGYFLVRRTAHLGGGQSEWYASEIFKKYSKQNNNIKNCL